MKMEEKFDSFLQAYEIECKDSERAQRMKTLENNLAEIDELNQDLGSRSYVFMFMFIIYNNHNYMLLLL